MSKETRYTGKDLDVQWVYSGGTVSLNADFKTLKTTEGTKAAERTAGADTHESFIPTIGTGKADHEMLDTTSSVGTQVWAALAKKTEGTLIWSPQGTATGKPKSSVAAYVDSRDREFPFDDVVNIKVSFQFQEDVTDATW